MISQYEGEIEIDSDGFMFFVEPEAKNDVVYDMKEFYEKHDFATDAYHKIAEIPFHLIITLSPDDAIHNTFDNNGLQHDFKYFDGYTAELEKPTIDKPLIYNLFGLATKGKYILTQEDYFNYLKATVGENVLPQKIVGELKKAGNFIFVGFDFEKWYNRLLLMILNFHTDKEQKTRHAIQQTKTGSLFERLAAQKFNITFVENNEEDFLETLLQKTKEAGIARTLTSKEELLKKQLAENMELLNKYSEDLTLETDYIRKKQIEKKIAEIKEDISKIKAQL